MTRIGVALAGEYGSLILNADGTYNYTIDQNDPAVQALAQNGHLTDQFTYKLHQTHEDEQLAICHFVFPKQVCVGQTSLGHSNEN